MYKTVWFSTLIHKKTNTVKATIRVILSPISATSLESLIKDINEFNINNESIHIQ